MKHLDLFFTFFNIFFGTIMILVSIDIIKLSKPVTLDWKWFLRLGGIGMILWGCAKLYLAFAP